MTKIDFHTDVADPTAFTCRLVRKVRTAAASSQIAILVKDDRELAVLDRALWTFSELDFLPHAMADDALASDSPVVLTKDADGVRHHDVLINLSGTLPPSFAQFERVIEIIPKGELEKTAGRERYGYYRQRGYALEHYTASES